MDGNSLGAGLADLADLADERSLGGEKNSTKPLSVVFMGSGAFAVEVLKKLIVAWREGELELLAVITQKDKPVGRKKVLTPTLVRQFCLEEGVANFPAENSPEILEIMSENEISCDFFIVADYGVILREEVLDFPKIGSWNVHGSVLPRYRGASPVHQALLEKDTETGISIITMTKKLDAGDVWMIKKLLIMPEDDYMSLLLKLGELGGEAVLELLKDRWYEGIVPEKQDESLVTFTGKIKKEDGLIDFMDVAVDAEDVLVKYRAYKLWPGIHFYFKETKFDILEFTVLKRIPEDVEIPGEVVSSEREFVVLKGRLFFVFTVDENGKWKSAIEIIKFKPASKKEMFVADFLRGNPTFFE